MNTYILSFSIFFSRISLLSANIKLRAHAYRCALFGNNLGGRMDEKESFKVTLESLYTNKIKEINYDEEETFQE